MSWSKMRAGVMFVLACATSPCCTPLIVPIVISLLAGTPIALWMSQNLGWVYGALTAVSIVSFLLALHWANKRKTNNVRTSDIPVRSPLAGENARVE